MFYQSDNWNITIYKFIISMGVCRNYSNFNSQVDESI